jgi:hypothetical protein
MLSCLKGAYDDLAAMSQLQYGDHDDGDDNHDVDDEQQQQQQQQQQQPHNIASSSGVIMLLQLVVLGELRMSTRMPVCLPAVVEI